MITMLTLFACTEGGGVWLDDTAPIDDTAGGGNFEIPLAEEGDRLLLTVAVEPGTEAVGTLMFGVGEGSDWPDPIVFEAMNGDLNVVEEFDSEVYLLSDPLTEDEASAFALIQAPDGSGDTIEVDFYAMQDLLFVGTPEVSEGYLRTQFSLWSPDGDDVTIYPLFLFDGGTIR